MDEKVEPCSTKKETISMRDYVDLRFNESQRAIDKAEKSICIRMDTMNEWRQAMTDREAKYLTREEYRLAHEALDGRLNSVKELSAKSITKDELALTQKNIETAGKDRTALAFAIVASVVSLISLIINIAVKAI